MARVQIPVTDFVRAGVSPPAQTDGDAVNKHYIAGNDGQIVIEVASSDAGAQTVTVKANPDLDTDGLIVSDLVLSVPASAAGAVAVTLLNHLIDQLRRVLGDRAVVQVAEISDSAQIRAELREEIQQLRDMIDKLQSELDSSRRAYRELLQQHGELEIEHRQLKREHDDLKTKYYLVKRELDDLRDLRLGRSG